jgi:hypothetical protein
MQRGFTAGNDDAINQTDSFPKITLNLFGGDDLRKIFRQTPVMTVKAIEITSRGE